MPSLENYEIKESDLNREALLGNKLNDNSIPVEDFTDKMLAISDTRVTADEMKDAIYQAHKSKDAIQSINAIDRELAPIYRLFREANNGRKDVVYAVVSDSTRSIDSSEWELLYPKYINQTGVTYFNNADPSQTVFDWMNNTDQNTMQQLIDASLGAEGEDTIVEFSMGLNDYTLYGNKADAKTSIKNGIVAYLTAKPKAKLFLVSPNWADNEGRRIALQEIYSELAVELDLLLLDGHIPTESLNLSADYYLDGTHPNPMGASRFLYWILNQIVPTDVIKNITIEEYTKPVTTAPLNSSIILNGLYDGSGVFFSNANYRCLELISLPEEPRRIDVSHGGNRSDVFFFDENDNLIAKKFISSSSGYVYPPLGSKTMAVNISSDGTSWDALSITPKVIYYVLPAYFSFKELTNFYKNKLYCTPFKYGILVDSYLKIGTNGQTLTIDSSNKMKWS